MQPQICRVMATMALVCFLRLVCQAMQGLAAEPDLQRFKMVTVTDDGGFAWTFRIDTQTGKTDVLFKDEVVAFKEQEGEPHLRPGERGPNHTFDVLAVAGFVPAYEEVMENGEVVSHAEEDYLYVVRLDQRTGQSWIGYDLYNFLWHPIAEPGADPPRGRYAISMAGSPMTLLRYDDRLGDTWRADPKTGTWQPLQNAHPLRSAPDKRVLNVVNDSDAELRVSLAGRDGEEQEYRTLRPGESYDQYSSAGHTWRFHLAGKSLPLFTMPDEPYYELKASVWQTSNGPVSNAGQAADPRPPVGEDQPAPARPLPPPPPTPVPGPFDR